MKTTTTTTTTTTALIITALTALVGLGLGCDTGRAHALSKDEARALLESGTAQGDPCAENGWYGDGVCDVFCPAADPDCAASSCLGAWRNAAGLCLGLADNPLPDSCCASCVGAWRNETGLCLGLADNPLPDTCCACPVIACFVGCEYGAKPDANGCATCECLPAPQPARCGGLAGLECPAGQRCIDDPAEPCGIGADCFGLCVLPCDATTGTGCPAGDACVPDPYVNCGPTQNCVGAGLCLPAGECLTDADCRLTEDYVTSCACIAVGPGVPDPSGAAQCPVYDCNMCAGSRAACDTATRTCTVVRESPVDCG
ncbi:MAG TPA: hypothetical protein VGQ83_34460 [Polyangia bacterium]|jgi:hypothetical protein